MKDLFVCMGTASTTETEAWVSQAKMAHTTMTTVSSGGPRPASAVLSTPRGHPRPVSAALPPTFSARPTSGRPISSLSAAESNWRDSGLGSPTKLSLFGSTLDVAGCGTNSVVSHDDRESLAGDDDGVVVNPSAVAQSRLFAPDSKPLTPRASDAVCQSVGQRGGPVYIVPQPSTPPQEEEEDDDTSPPPSEVSTEAPPSERSAHSPAPSDGSHTLMDLDATSPYVFDDLDQLGSLVVGTVLKYVVAETAGIPVEEVLKSHKVIKDMYPNNQFTDFQYEDFDKLEFLTQPKPRKPTTESLSDTSLISEPPSAKSTTSTREPPSGEIQKQELTRTTSAVDSDEDSMLDSDGEYDEDRDKIFKKRRKRFKLINKKGMDKFKRFLRSTRGEKNWYFWLDVDRGRMLIKPADISG